MIAGRSAQAAIDQQAGDRVEQGDDDVGQQPEQDTADAEPEQADALETAGILGMGKRIFARLAEKNDAEKLDHGKSGERGD